MVLEIELHSVVHNTRVLYYSSIAELLLLAVKCTVKDQTLGDRPSSFCKTSISE